MVRRIAQTFFVLVIFAVSPAMAGVCLQGEFEIPFLGSATSIFSKKPQSMKMSFEFKSREDNTLALFTTQILNPGDTVQTASGPIPMSEFFEPDQVELKPIHGIAPPLIVFESENKQFLILVADFKGAANLMMIKKYDLFGELRIKKLKTCPTQTYWK